MSLQDRVAAVPFWFHKIELPGVTTPGFYPVDPALYEVPADLTGLRVLDVGAWDGYWSFEAAKRGASEVLAIDDFSDAKTADLIPRSDLPDWHTFDLCRDALGYTNVRRETMSVYEVTPERCGTFDVVLFFGVLYHLRHPLYGLERISSVCRKAIYVESAICDEHSAYLGRVKGLDTTRPVMEFLPGKQLGGNASNWWLPSATCIAAMLADVGFGKAIGSLVLAITDDADYRRCFLHADKHE